VKKPDFFIVGAPKCGTTALSYYLMQHPEIYMAVRLQPSPRLRAPAFKRTEDILPQIKDLHFFGSDLRFTTPRMDEQEYLSYFSGAQNKKRIGEVSIWYLYSRLAAVEIQQFNPNADIIIMLRNPVDMMYALHAQMVYRGYEDIVDFASALEAEKEREHGLCITGKTPPLIETLLYRKAASFSDQVKRFLEVFGREKVHIIIFDDLKTDTAQVYRDTLKFLGVDENYEADLKVVNRNKGIRSRKVDFLFNRPHGIIRKVARLLVPRSLGCALVHQINRLNTQNKPRPAMDSELRKKLQEEFASEVKRLSDLIGRDLTHWSRS